MMRRLGAWLRLLALLTAASCGSTDSQTVDLGARGASGDLGPWDASLDALAAPDAAPDAMLSGPTRVLYTGTLDGNGDTRISVPEIDLADMPTVQGWVFSSAYAEPAFVAIGNLIPAAGTFRFQAGIINADAEYVLVVDRSPTRVLYTGTLDGNGDARPLVPEIDVAAMPIVQGWVFSSAYAEPAFVVLGNLIPASGTFRFQAGAGNADAAYILVVDPSPMRVTYTGTLDSSGDARISVPAIDLLDVPLTQGWVFSSAYVEPAFVVLGNLIPATGTFRFQAGVGNADAAYKIVVAP